jgi:hypothetical protein
MNDNTIVSIPKQRAEEKARYFASLHCKHFQECLRNAGIDDVPMNCSTCEEIEVIRDRYLDELGGEYFNKPCRRYPLHVSTK